MSDFFNKYPYTDFHELNLDWVIERVKELTEDWAATLTEWHNTQEAWETEQQAFQDLHDYVMNYFNNLDVQEEINHKLDQMAADGTLDALILPYFNQYKTEINNIISQQNAAISIISQRVDNIATLAEGSTTGDAELIDGRVDFTGNVNANIGSAIRSMTKFNYEMQTGSGYYPAEYAEVKTGYYIQNSDHTIQPEANYDLYCKIRLAPLQGLHVSATIGDSYSMINLYKADGTFVEAASVAGASSAVVEKYYYNKSGEILYAYVTAATGTSVTIEKCNASYEPFKYFDDGVFSDLGVYSRYNHTGSNAVISNVFYAAAGQTIRLRSYMNVATRVMLWKCDRYGMNKTAIATYASFTNNTYSYMSRENTYYIAVQFLVSPHRIFIEDVRPLLTDTIGNTKTTAVINFQFDDGVSEDSDIYDLFLEKGLKCGFVLPTSAGANIPNYVDRYNAGFDVLAHSTDSTAMSDDTASLATIKTKMITSIEYLRGYGFDVRGWVTPSSVLNDIYKPLLDTIYDYAFVNPLSPGTVYNTRADSPRNLKRCSERPTLESVQTVIDDCIAANGFLTLYYHAANMTPEGMTLLGQTLDYVNTKIASKDLVCLAPNDAIDFYFRR